MTKLTRDAILAVVDLPSETVPCPEWGGEVSIRGMTGSERDAFEQSLFIGDADSKRFSADNVRAKLLVRCIVDENGERIFKDEDVEALGRRSAQVLDRLYDVAQRLSGIGKKDLESAVKN